MNLLCAGGTFNWYGFLIGMAMLVCIFSAWCLLKKRGYNPDMVFNVAIICIPCAIIGARLYYIIFDIIGGTNTFADWFNNSEGQFTLKKFIGFADDGTYDGLMGLAIYGGLIAAALGGLIVRAINKRDKNPRNRMTYIQMLDAFFILIILGQAIGRWGNYANGEAYGNAVINPDMQWFPYAVEISGKWYQATFFYESFLNLIGFGLMLWMWLGKRKSYDGFIFSFYCLWYGFVRLFIEGLRSDSLYTQGGFNICFFAMFIFAGVAIATIYTGKEFWLSKKNNEKFEPKKLIMYAGLYLFSLYCLIFGVTGLLIQKPLRISQLVSIALIVWGATNIIGHIVKAYYSKKRPFIFIERQKLSIEYMDYDKSIEYICKTYEKDGQLISNTDLAVEPKIESSDIESDSDSTGTI